MLITDSSTAPIALLLVSVVSTSGAPGWGKVRVAASERKRCVLVKADCCSVFQVRFLGFSDNPDSIPMLGQCWFNVVH